MPISFPRRIGQLLLYASFAALWSVSACAQPSTSTDNIALLEHDFASVERLGDGPNAPIRVSLAGSKNAGTDIRELRAQPPIDSLDASFTDVTGDEFMHLDPAVNLRSLNLSHTRCSDAGLPFVVLHKGIESLDLSATPVTDAGLRRLADLPRLATLRLVDVNISGQGLAALAKSQSLRSLEVRSLSGIDEQGTKAIGQLTSLRRLHLSSLKASTDRSSDLRSLVNLEELMTDLTPRDYDDPRIAFTAGMTRLRVLVAPYGSGKEADIRALVGARELERLSLVGANLDDAQIKQIATLQRLEQLDLTIGTPFGTDGSRMGVDALRDLASLPRLKRLSLDGHSASDEAVTLLAECQSLEYLDLERNAVTEIGVAALAKLPRLKHLNLSSTEVQRIPDNLPANLSTLNLGRNSLTGDVFAALETIPQLATLDLYSSHLDAAAWASLAGARHLRRLELCNTNLEQAELKQLADMEKLEWLDMSGIELRSDDLEILFEFPKLKVLAVDVFDEQAARVLERLRERGVAVHGRTR